tara:strand:- start:4397 stop:5242 length:846 start_codon:yes stop_codon:yes gene_type:complete
MNILVTGGAGAVGSNLIERLLKDNHKVTSWDNYSSGLESNHIKGCNYLRIDTQESEQAFDPNFDLVYHLGEYSKIVPSFNEIKKIFNFNIKGSFELIEQCSKHNVPIVYASSSTKLHADEKHSPYSFFKSTITNLIQAYGNWYGLKYNICYFFNVYGPKTDTWGNEYQTVINIFHQQKQQEIPLTITGDGTQCRDFTHVEDIVDGLILAGQNIHNTLFQFGSGKEYSMLEIANAFDHQYTFIPSRPGDRQNGVADINYTKLMLGYNPKHNIIKYIKEIIKQ